MMRVFCILAIDEETNQIKKGREGRGGQPAQTSVIFGRYCFLLHVRLVECDHMVFCGSLLVSSKNWLFYT